MTAFPAYEVRRTCRRCEHDYDGYTFSKPTDAQQLKGICGPCSMAHDVDQRVKDLAAEVSYWESKARLETGSKKVHAVSRIERAVRMQRDATANDGERVTLETYRRKVARRLAELREAA